MHNAAGCLGTKGARAPDALCTQQHKQINVAFMQYGEECIMQQDVLAQKVPVRLMPCAHNSTNKSV
jgi:hypothetical protein